jgi:hypothetical protein
LHPIDIHLDVCVVGDKIIALTDVEVDLRDRTLVEHVEVAIDVDSEVRAKRADAYQIGTGPAIDSQHVRDGIERHRNTWQSSIFEQLDAEARSAKGLGGRGFEEFPDPVHHDASGPR